MARFRLGANLIDNALYRRVPARREKAGDEFLRHGSLLVTASGCTYQVGDKETSNFRNKDGL